MKKQSMKKILALMLSLTMALSFTACGSSSDSAASDAGTDSAAEETTDGNDTEEDEDDEYADLDFSDLVADDDYEYAEDSADYDFNETVDEDFAAGTAIANTIDENNLSEGGDQIIEMVTEAVKCIDKEFETFGDYDDSEDESLDMGEQVYAVAMQPDDVDVIDTYMEGGVYLKLSENRYYHYFDYCSKNIEEVNDADIKEVATELKQAMGVTISEADLSKAFDAALGGLYEQELDMYYLQSQNTRSGNGYDENISVVICAVNNGDGTYFAYLNCERERAY